MTGADVKRQVMEALALQRGDGRALAEQKAHAALDGCVLLTREEAKVLTSYVTSTYETIEQRNWLYAILAHEADSRSTPVIHSEDDD